MILEMFAFGLLCCDMCATTCHHSALLLGLLFPLCHSRWRRVLLGLRRHRSQLGIRGGCARHSPPLGANRAPQALCL